MGSCAAIASESEWSEATPSTRPARCRGDRGTVIAEAAFLTPFFVTLIFGMLEFGGAFRDYLTSSTGTVNGARTAAIWGNDAGTDWYVLSNIVTATGAMPLSQIQQVIIYKATGTSTGPPAGCLAAKTCNTYSQADLQDLGTGTTPPTTPLGANWAAGTHADQNTWIATTRDVLASDPTTNPDGPDFVGVYIKVIHPWITGLFGSSITLTSNTVSQLEPQKLAS